MVDGAGRCGDGNEAADREGPKAPGRLPTANVHLARISQDTELFRAWTPSPGGSFLAPLARCRSR